MAEVDDVPANVSVYVACDNAKLLCIDFSSRGLVISDCEGFEMELFTEEGGAASEKRPSDH